MPKMKMKVKLIEDPNRKQREKKQAEEEAIREERYRRGYAQSVADVYVLIVGGASKDDIWRFQNLSYQWRAHGKVYAEELLNMTAVQPTDFIFKKDNALLEIYNRGLKQLDLVSGKQRATHTNLTQGGGA